MNNVIYPTKFFPRLHVGAKMHAYTPPGCSGISFWGEYQVKSGRKIVSRFPTLAEALKRFPAAVVIGNWPEDDELADKHNDALMGTVRAA